MLYTATYKVVCKPHFTRPLCWWHQVKVSLVFSLGCKHFPVLPMFALVHARSLIIAALISWMQRTQTWKRLCFHVTLVPKCWLNGVYKEITLKLFHFFIKFKFKHSYCCSEIYSDWIWKSHWTTEKNHCYPLLFCLCSVWFSLLKEQLQLSDDVGHDVIWFWIYSVNQCKLNLGFKF